MVGYRIAIALGVLLAVVAGSAIVFTLTSYLPSQSVETGPGNIVPNQPNALSKAMVANITVSGYPYEIAADASLGKVYVSDTFANKLTVINATSYAVLGTITLPGTPESGLSVDAANNMVYVPVYDCTNMVNASNNCDYGARSAGIVEIDGVSDSIVGEIHIGVDRLAVDASTGVLFGTSSDFLLTIDGKSGSLIANTSLGAFPLSIAVDSARDMADVSACKQPTEMGCIGAELLEINGTSHEVQSVVSLCSEHGMSCLMNFNVVVNPDTNTVYAAGVNEGDALALISIDGTNGKVRYSSDLGPSCLGAAGGTVALDVATDMIYASSYIPGGFFLVFNGSTGRVINALSDPAGVQYTAFNSGTGQVYLTMEAASEAVGFLVVLPASTNQGQISGSASLQGIC
jgi:DNA-binding beta-propeller fold protein YncE